MRRHVWTYMAIGVAMFVAFLMINFMLVSTGTAVSEGKVERFADIPYIGNALDGLDNATDIRYRCIKKYRGITVIFATTVEPGAVDELLKVRSHPDWLVETGWGGPPVDVPELFREFDPQLVRSWSTHHLLIGKSDEGAFGLFYESDEELFYDPETKKLWGKFHLDRSRISGQ